MSSNKNRFNTSRNTKNWFPFAKYIFSTDNHPVRLTEEKCSSSIEALFSKQELQQIVGITNSLQCPTRDAVRIALFEAVKDAQAVHDKSYDKAKSGSTIKGHEGRSEKKRLNLPKSEKDAVELAAKQLKISVKEFLRLAVIWIADGIKDESITRLTKSKRIGKDEVARQWSRENQGKEPSESVARFKKVRDEAYNQAATNGQERDEELYKRRGEKIKELNRSELGRVYERFGVPTKIVNGHPVGGIDLNLVDALIAIDEQDSFDAAIAQYKEHDELERQIFSVLCQLPEDAPYDLAEEMAKSNIAERKESHRFQDWIHNCSDEELIDTEPELFWTLRTPFGYTDMMEFDWNDENDMLRKDGESVDAYIRRALPDSLIPKWDAYAAEVLRQLDS